MARDPGGYFIRNRPSPGVVWDEYRGYLTWSSERGMWIPTRNPDPGGAASPVASAHPDAVTTIFPDGQSGVPLRVWGNAASNQLATSHHFDQFRWVKVTVFFDQVQPAVMIPLIDAGGIPFIAPETAPLSIVRRVGNSPFFADYVTNPEGTVWGDELTCWRLNGAYAASGSPLTRASFKLLREPVPHWGLLVDVKNQAASSTTYSNVMIDMITSGPGASDGAATTLEVGTSGVHGHYRIKSIWPHQSFMSASSRINMNRVMATRGAIDVAGGASGTYYLATPNALSTDTSAFNSSDVPAVRVLGHYASGAYLPHTPETGWQPTTLGLGGWWPMTPALLKPAWLYASGVSWNAGAGRWQVSIYNNITGSAANRTFFVFALGRST